MVTDCYKEAPTEVQVLAPVNDGQRSGKVEKGRKSRRGWRGDGGRKVLGENLTSFHDELSLKRW